MMSTVCYTTAVHAMLPTQNRRHIDSGWQFVRGDLGSIWEVWHPVQPGKPQAVPLWKAVTLPHCFNDTDACDPDEPSVCIRFYIEDDLLAWNNGYFTYLFDNGKCIETEQQPDYEVSMSIGTLTTLMLGYKTAEKLHVMDKIQASDEAVEHLDDILFHRIPYVSDYI